MTNETNLDGLAEKIYECNEKLRTKAEKETAEKAKQAEIIRIRQSEEKEYEKEKFELYIKIHEFIKHFSTTDVFKDFFQINNRRWGYSFGREEEIYRKDIPGYVHASQSGGRLVVWSRVSLAQNGSLNYRGLESRGIHTEICYAAKINKYSLKEIRHEIIKDLHEIISSGKVYQTLEDSLKS